MIVGGGMTSPHRRTTVAPTQSEALLLLRIEDIRLVSMPDLSLRLTRSAAAATWHAPAPVRPPGRRFDLREALLLLPPRTKRRDYKCL